MYSLPKTCALNDGALLSEVVHLQWISCYDMKVEVKSIVTTPSGSMLCKPHKQGDHREEIRSLIARTNDTSPPIHINPPSLRRICLVALALQSAPKPIPAGLSCRLWNPSGIVSLRRAHSSSARLGSLCASSTYDATAHASNAFLPKSLRRFSNSSALTADEWHASSHSCLPTSTYSPVPLGFRPSRSPQGPHGKSARSSSHS